MGKNKIEGPFVALLLTTLESPAWKALSHGSKWLYVALKRRKSNNGNRAYISYRTAQKEIKSSTKKIGEWFAELKHYGFIELMQPHSLGLDGKGKAPHWRLTECGRTSKASENGIFEPPTNDFLRWDGTLFDAKPYRCDTGWDFQNRIPSTTWNTPRQRRGIHPRIPRRIHPTSQVSTTWETYRAHQVSTTLLTYLV